MGKTKFNDSDNQMDVQQHNDQRMELENSNKVFKKNKKITKNRNFHKLENKNHNNKLSSSNDIIKKVAKMVNLKKKQRSLVQKQQIFKKVVKGLHGNNLSKKQRKKSRILMKKQLQKALHKQQKIESKAAFSTMQSQKSLIIKKRKQPINQKAQVLKMRSVMGQSLSSLKTMLANRI